MRRRRRAAEAGQAAVADVVLGEAAAGAGVGPAGAGGRLEPDLEVDDLPARERDAPAAGRDLRPRREPRDVEVDRLPRQRVGEEDEDVGPGARPRARLPRHVVGDDRRVAQHGLDAHLVDREPLVELQHDPRRHRARLAAATTAAGFAPYEKEWWHFSVAAKDERRFDVPVR
jgi:hypothetical protein